MARRRIRIGPGAVLAIVGGVAIVAIALWPRKAAAAPMAPATSGKTSSELFAQVQADRQAELTQWQTVARNAQKVLDSLQAQGLGNTPQANEWRQTISHANAQIAALEQSIAAYSASQSPSGVLADIPYVT